MIKEAVVFKTDTTGTVGTKLVTGNERFFYSDLVPIVIKAIQEQQLLIAGKDAKIQQLKSE